MFTLLALAATPVLVDQEWWEPTKLPSWAFSSSIRESSGEAVSLDYDRPISAADLSAFFANESKILLGAVLPDPPAHTLRTGRELPAFIRETNGIARVAVTRLVPEGLEIVGLGCQTTARHTQPESQFKNWHSAYKAKFGKPMNVILSEGQSSGSDNTSSIAVGWSWVYPSGKNIAVICYYQLATTHVFVDYYLERGVQKKKTYRTFYPARAIAVTFDAEMVDEILHSMDEASDKLTPSRASVR